MKCFHKWCKWTDFISEGRNEAQERRCEKCGLVEMKLKEFNKRRIK